jgi:predicted GIY-YIG superfamily endonuclease
LRCYLAYHRLVIPGRAAWREPGIHNHRARDGLLRLSSCQQKHGTLYLGVTNDIVRRGYEHRTKAAGGFTARYDVDKLVWFEIYDDAVTAIAREKRNQEMETRLEDQAH